MALTLTGTELYTGGWYSTNVGKQTGEQIFSWGYIRGVLALVEGLTGLEIYTDGYYSTRIGKQTGEQILSFGLYRGALSPAEGGSVGIWAHILYAKKNEGQFVPI
jgi:hypothetical protein